MGCYEFLLAMKPYRRNELAATHLPSSLFLKHIFHILHVFNPRADNSFGQEDVMFNTFDFGMRPHSRNAQMSSQPPQGKK